MSACQSFRPVAPFFFLAKVPFLFVVVFFGSVFFIKKGVWPYKYADDIPMVTLILNIYGILGLTSSMNTGHTDRRKDRLFALYIIDKSFLFSIVHAHSVNFIILY